MKIRCKNCYRVLKPQEEYCTHCGEHSEQIQKAMQTGYYEEGQTDRLKGALALYLFSAIIGNGIYMIILGAIQNKITSTYQDLFCMSNSLLISSLVSLLITIFVYRKEFKDIFLSGTSKQKLLSLVLGILVVIMCVLFTRVSKVTQVLPSFITKYLDSSKATFFNGEDTSIFRILLAFCSIYIVEEIVLRHRLITTLDEDTMLSDGSIIFISSIVCLFGDFLWTMSVETLIVSFLINLTLSYIYINTERNIGINICLRILLLLILLCI